MKRSVTHLLHSFDTTVPAHGTFLHNIRLFPSGCREFHLPPAFLHKKPESDPPYLLQEANIKELVDRQPDGLDEEIGQFSKTGNNLSISPCCGV